MLPALGLHEGWDMSPVCSQVYCNSHLLGFSLRIQGEKMINYYLNRRKRSF